MIVRFKKTINEKKNDRLRQNSSTRGSVTIIAVVLATGLIFALTAGLSASAWFGASMKHRAATDAASLECAKQFSQIVIDDPQFGFVALSDLTPGTRTVSAAGEQLPVTGINSLQGNLRQIALLAARLNCPALHSLVANDVVALKTTREKLIAAWQDAALPVSQSQHLAFDANNNEIHLTQTASTAYSRYMGSATPLTQQNFKIDLGVLAHGGYTNTPVPATASEAQLAAGDVYNQNYASDRNLPVADIPFTFATLSSEARLVDHTTFQPWAPGDARLPSVLRLQTTVPSLKIEATACAIAPSYKSLSNLSTMIVGFPQGYSNQVASLAQLMVPTSSATLTCDWTAQAGDYPIDLPATTVELIANAPNQSSQAMAQCVHDFLKSTNIQGPKTLDELTQALTQPLFTSQEQRLHPVAWLAFHLDNRGDLQRTLMPTGPLSKGVTSENQLSGSISSDPASNTNSDTPPLVVNFWDETRNPGRQSGGKHGGNPLLIDYLNGLVLDTSDSLANIVVDESEYLAALKEANTAAAVGKLRLAADIEISPPQYLNRHGGSQP